MALTPRLDQRQTQSLVMTPQLQQAIKLLQLSNMELAEFVEQELEQNPMLERDDAEAADGDTEAVDGAAETAAGVDDGSPDDGMTMDFGDDGGGGPADGDMDVALDDLYTQDGRSDAVQAAPDPGYEPVLPSSVAGGFDDDLPGFEQTLSSDITLRDHLMEQLGMDVGDQIDRMIGAFLIDSLDETGYLTIDLAAVAEALECDVARVEAVLKRLQQFDPPGIFARDLKECLGLQLADRDRLDPAMAAFIDNLELVARREFKALARICGVDAEDVADMAAELRTLDPKPALAFDGEIAQPVIPDVLMRARPSGGWHIELNSDTLPRVLVNNQYYAEISAGKASKADRQYITEQYQSANWLVKSLHQRATTILKVAKEIVRQQDAFFLKGVQHLKPLVLRDIADVIDMHESTVSRVTANKYIASPRGIFELKYFFTSSIARADGGEAFSAEAIKHRIRAMITAEPPAQVLSDDKIVDILRADGVDIARRTVAKYREAMGIPSSVQRRRQKSPAM
ncbi:MAG: RNA polymerase sigma-54 factor [Rhodospirillales bacterium CG15_BIG_FIL_POST_REV_8_21_14_020_66_15]|nr:MAG: RNA polymerase sigma-54 factor [Rhodospirillales bacterium CG15_BIG_FIL_POST_REV_8_21_14_020_66_15]